MTEKAGQGKEKGRPTACSCGSGPLGVPAPGNSLRPCGGCFRVGPVWGAAAVPRAHVHAPRLGLSWRRELLGISHPLCWQRGQPPWRWRARWGREGQARRGDGGQFPAFTLCACSLPLPRLSHTHSLCPAARSRFLLLALNLLLLSALSPHLGSSAAVIVCFSAFPPHCP